MLTPKMQILERQWQADTQSGETLHFEACKGGYFSEKEEYGLKVVGTEKNLLSHITTYNEPWTATLPECEPITFEAGKTYTISFAQPPSGKWRIMIYSDVFSADDGDYYWINTFGYGSSNIFSYGRIQYQFANLTGNSLSFVPNHTFIAYGIQVWNIDSTPAEIVEPQLEIGAVATAYVPYGTCVKAGSEIIIRGENLFKTPNLRNDYSRLNDNLVGFNVDISRGIVLGGLGDSAKYEIFNNGFSFIRPGGWYNGIGFPITNVKPNTTYVLSFESSDNLANIGFCFYDSDLKLLPYAWGAKITDNCYKATTPTNTKIIVPTFYGEVNIETTITNLQLIEGSIFTPYKPYILPQEIVTPCDLYSGEIWYPMSGKVYKQDVSVEQYNPQPIFAPQGTVNVIQEPVELSTELSATMLCKGVV